MPKHIRMPKAMKYQLNLPKRPLCSYNYFFRAEREKIIKEKGSKNGNKIIHQEPPLTNQIERESTKDEAPEEAGIASNETTPGKSFFSDLGKEIARRWEIAKLKPEDLLQYQQMAAVDMERYKREKEVYVEQGKAAKQARRLEIKSEKQKGKLTEKKDQQRVKIKRAQDEPEKHELPTKLAGHNPANAYGDQAAAAEHRPSIRPYPSNFLPLNSQVPQHGHYAPSSYSTPTAGHVLQNNGTRFVAACSFVFFIVLFFAIPGLIISTCNY